MTISEQKGGIIMKKVVLFVITIFVLFSALAGVSFAKPLSSPVIQVGKITLPENSGATLVKVQDGKLLVGGYKTITNEIGTHDYCAFWIYSLEDPSNPELLGEFVKASPTFMYTGNIEGEVKDMILDGNRAYLSMGIHFIVLDVSKPEFKIVKSIMIEEGPTGLFKFGKYVFVGRFMASTPVVIDTENNYKMTELQFTNPPEDCEDISTAKPYVYNGKLYLIGGSLIETDISTLPNIKVLHKVCNEDFDMSVYVTPDGRFVYANSVTPSIGFEVADLDIMKVYSSGIPNDYELVAFAKEGRTLYALANTEKVLVAIDVLNPTKPKVKWTINTDKKYTSIAVYRGHIYLAKEKIPEIPILSGAPFKDVGPDYWAIEAINYMVSKNIVSGYPDGTFKPEKIVTRAEYAKMLALSLGLKIGEGRDIYTDVPSKHWAYKYITAVTDAKLMKGYGKGKFGPDDTVKKEEIITTIVRLKNWKLINPQTGTFPDVPKKYWAYPYIETVVSHNLIKKVDKGLTDGNFHIKIGATRAQTAELLYRAIGK
jgi:hypothetical protein